MRTVEDRTSFPEAQAAGVPGPECEDWTGFLHWLVDEHSYTAHDVVYVVEKARKFWPEYSLYRMEKERDA